MSDTYNVDLQNVEGNAARISFSGAVNGRQVAATLMRHQVLLKDAAYDKAVVSKAWSDAAKRVMASALVDAFLQLTAPQPEVGAITITR